MGEMAIPELGDLEVLAGEILAEVIERSAAKERATVLALHGELGAGKTTFVQILAKRLGVSEYVTSPTFVIMRLYPIKTHAFFKTLVHIDAYRVESLDEVAVIGFEDILRDPANLVCIEWAERVVEALPLDALHITFTQSGTSGMDTMRTAVYGYKEEADEKRVRQHANGI